MAPPPAAGDYDSDDLVDYDEGDYGEGEDELSPEDKVAMSQGTADVQKALGDDANKVTAKQIQDALWHYFYDIEKSVSYLKKTYIAPPPKPAPKKAPEGMSTAVSFPAAFSLFGGDTGADQEHSAHYGLAKIPRSFSPTPHHPVLQTLRASCGMDFSDMPWLNIPEHRRTVFVEPLRPRGGLLGGGEGAPKTSKLQALAAARKKKNGETKDQDKTSQTTKAIHKLSISDEHGASKENQKPLPSLAKRQKTSALETTDPSPTLRVSSTETGANNHHDSEMNLDGESATQTTTHTTPSALSDEAPFVSQQAAPTAFAKTLFGSAPEASRTQERDVFAMPYTASSSFFANAFSEPSPDDVVLEAQAKGSNFAKAK